MQTVIFQEIDDYKIVKGFGELSPDRVETLKKIGGKIKKLESNKRIETLSKKIDSLNGLIKAIHPAIPWCENIPSLRALLAKKSESEIQQAINYIEERSGLLKELVEVKKKAKIERNKLFLKNAVYFDPTPYEIVKSDEEIKVLKEKFANLKENQKLSTDGNIISDFSGKQYWIKKDKWETMEYKMGEMKDRTAKTMGELTEIDRAEIADQLDLDRISGLSEDEKVAEKQEAIEALTIQAVNKKAGYEIQGDTSKDALKKSKDWFKAEKKKIDRKYGV